ncbi:class I SAM-dependent rRNA methyltransferase [Myxococcota bacterium]|nr:class I SAM-dependent rRNA methyltransferase [Myxococcota bacterium]
MRALPISLSSARIVGSGHPWVIRDEGTGDTSPFRPGDPVDLVDSRGGFVARALVDPRSRVVARVVSRRRVPVDEALFQERARAALGLRLPLMADGTTDAVRLINAEGDGLPGLEVDRYGDVLVAVRRTPLAAPLSEAVYPVLKEAFPGATIYEKDHFRDLRLAESLLGRLIQGDEEPAERTATERGLRFGVRPFAGLATGLYADQRENRDLLVSRGKKRVLNTFCFTGAFSVALARGGAVVTSVDQSRPALETLRRNLERNGIDPRAHTILEQDVRRFLEGTRERFDLAILDPPTFSTGRDRGHWAARSSYSALAGACFSRLVEGGELFACINDRRASHGELLEALQDAARHHGRDVQVLAEGRTGIDFPWPAAFPEGRTHRAVLVRLL